MLKTQRQNLIMENEFHIKEERVKAQQSSIKSQDTHAALAHTASTDGSEKSTTKMSSSVKIKTTKPDGSSGNSALPSFSAKAITMSSKSSTSQDVSAKKENSCNTSSSELSSGINKNSNNGAGEKQTKEKGHGKDGLVRKATVNAGGIDKNSCGPCFIYFPYQCLGAVLRLLLVLLFLPLAIV